ncbi:histidine kinase [Kribbella flavida DSM 17836]|uniref:histidine kinase n=1 Tax=Kribbella flavida (strain DSM 17836 / JCM 10339 / NBRC 14399) TaxID=479435 RepID=D2PS72_KRIFD|nr:histidine kinase [Kribbella flavida]ADB31196.1 histidine kinase [Kribbella flavida DSM 17836]
MLGGQWRAGGTALNAAVGMLVIAVFWLPVDLTGSGAVLELGLTVVLLGGLLLRGRFATTALVLTGATTLTGALLNITQDPFVAVAWTLYPVAVRRSSAKIARTVGTVVLVAVTVLGFTGTREVAEAARYALISVLVLTGSWALGEATRRQLVEVEQNGRLQAEQAVLAERLRLVREVHDVVSHSLTSITLSAGVAAHVAPGDAERLSRELIRVEQSGRQALADLRIVLGAARDDNATAERAPTPGLEALAGLVADVRPAGVPAELALTGREHVPPSLEPTIYRIVQESLTNAVRHAQGARCTVTVTGRPEVVDVEIVSGRGTGTTVRPPAGGAGYGLLGLRERVELVNGDFHSGPLPDGGFRVAAVIPTQDRR